MSQLFQQSETLTVGGKVFTDLVNLKILYGSMGQTTPWSTFRESNSTSGYVVPGGKTFKIMALKWVAGINGGYIALAYGNTDVGFNSGSAPTTPIYIAGSTGLGGVANLWSAFSPASSVVQEQATFDIPTGKYPAVAGSGGVSGSSGVIMIYGYEV